MYDRAMQALYAMGLDPIAETTADRKSFGFVRGALLMMRVNTFSKFIQEDIVLNGFQKEILKGVLITLAMNGCQKIYQWINQS